MFPPLDIPFQYCIEHFTLGGLYLMFRFSIWIFYRGVPGFATDCLCGVWCRELTTCPLYIGPIFVNLVWNVRGFVSLALWTTFTHTLMSHSMIILYFCLFCFLVSNRALFLHSTLLLSLYIDVVLTLSTGVIAIADWRYWNVLFIYTLGIILLSFVKSPVQSSGTSVNDIVSNLMILYVPCVRILMK